MKEDKEKVVYEPVDEHDQIFYGELGVERRMPFVRDLAGMSDGDYDRDNPEGTAWGRRNYRETCYLSSMPELSPGEYTSRFTKQVTTFKPSLQKKRGESLFLFVGWMPKFNSNRQKQGSPYRLHQSDTW